MRFKRKLLTAAIAGSLALVLTGCQLPRDMSLIPPLNDSGPQMRPGEKEPELGVAEAAKLCFATAEDLDKGGKDAEAISLYEKARQADKSLAKEATRRLAVLYDRSGNFDKALDEYRRGLQENPKDAELLNDLGYGYYCRNQWAEAEKNLRKAVAANPKYVNAWMNLGLTLAVQGKNEESLQAFGKVVTKAQALCNLALIQARHGKIEEARLNYQLALQHEPGLQIARTALEVLHRPSAAQPSQIARERFPDRRKTGPRETRTAVAGEEILPGLPDMDAPIQIGPASVAVPELHR